MSSTRIEHLIDDAQAAFDRRPAEIEPGLDVFAGSRVSLRRDELAPYIRGQFSQFTGLNIRDNYSANH